MLPLFLQYEGDVKRYIQHQLNCQKTSEDLTQETWLRFSRMQSIEHIADVKSFLIRIAGNLTIDYLRRRQTEERVRQESHTVQAAQVSLGPERVVSAQQQYQQLTQAMSELPTQCRVAFALHRLKGKRYSEIAEILGISEKTVENHILRALKHCRQKVNRQQ